MNCVIIVCLLEKLRAKEWLNSNEDRENKMYIGAEKEQQKLNRFTFVWATYSNSLKSFKQSTHVKNIGAWRPVINVMKQGF